MELEVREVHGAERWWRLILALTLVNINFVSKPKLMYSTIFFTHITNPSTLYKVKGVNITYGKGEIT
jgi:hypothetical protein